MNYIFNFSRISDIGNIKRTCKKFNNVFKSTWVFLLKRDFGINILKRQIEYAETYYKFLHTGIYIPIQQKMYNFSDFMIEYGNTVVVDEKLNFLYDCGNFIGIDEKYEIKKSFDDIKNCKIIFYFPKNHNILHINSITHVFELFANKSMTIRKTPQKSCVNFYFVTPKNIIYYEGHKN